MRIGVFLLGSQPQSGGAYTYERTVVQTVLGLARRHQFVLFHYGDAAEFDWVPASDRVSLGHLPGFWARNRQKMTEFVNLQLRQREERAWRTNALHLAIDSQFVDLIWFPTTAYEYVPVPFIYTLWDLQHRVQPFFPEVSVAGADWMERERKFGYILPRAAYVVVPNETAKVEVMRCYGVLPNRIIPIHQPAPILVESKPETIDLDVLAKFKLSKPFVFYPAQFWPHKNHIVLIEALRKLVDDFSLDVEVVFSGSDKGNLEYVLRYAEKRQLKDRIHYIGFVQPHEIAALYRNALCLAFCSFFGPENIPPLEAMSHGCPAIVSRFEGATEQLGTAAIFFDPTSEQDLANKIVAVCTDAELRRRLISEGSRLVTRVAPERYGERLVALFDSFSTTRRTWSSKVPYVHP